jgi:type IV pilus assembly protein PilB
MIDDKILITSLIKKSIISDELGQKLLNEAIQTSRGVESILYDRHIVDELSVVKAKSEILSIPYRSVKAEEITDELIKLIPEETAQNYQLLPLSKDDKMIIAGMVNPQDVRAQEALRFIAKESRLSLGVYVITPSDWQLGLRRYSPYQTEIESVIRSLNFKPGQGLSSLQRKVALEEGAAVSEEAPIIKIVSATMKAAVEQGASDVHIEPQRTRLRIRFRIDGALKEVSSFPLEIHQQVISRIKILSNLKIDENRIPQDGRFRTVIFGRDIDFRVSTFPTPVGEKAAIRVLDPSVGLKGVDSLGLIGRNGDLVKKAIERAYGMVLVTGPTGSGKTTTLYALLQILNKEDVNILSLEDPVEYFVEGLNQSQVHPEIGYNFASGLRQIVRQDPDVIMVGEIRDNETAELAIHAALTGHVVLSTLHTNNAVGVIPRLIDMGAQPFILPATLNLMLSQRLVRQLCDKCRKAEVAPPEIQEIIKKELDKLPAEDKASLKYQGPYQIYHAPGCNACKSKGFTGRVGLFEAFVMTRELEEIISSGASEGKIYDEARRQGMISMRQDGVLKSLDGMVAMEEVLRETAET